MVARQCLFLKRQARIMKKWLRRERFGESPIQRMGPGIGTCITHTAERTERCLESASQHRTTGRRGFGTSTTKTRVGWVKSLPPPRKPIMSGITSPKSAIYMYLVWKSELHWGRDGGRF